MDYLEKLKDPRWQKKRLEILQRDDWKCKACGEIEETLHVHHLVYRKNRLPWEIYNGLLLSLCTTCHSDVLGEDETENSLGCFLEKISIILEAFYKLGFDEIETTVLADAIARCPKPPNITPDDWKFEIVISPIKGKQRWPTHK